MSMRSKLSPGILLAITLAGWSLPASGEVVLLSETSGRIPDTESLGDPADLENTPYTVSFDAGAMADKLVVTLSSEGGNTATITYGGAPLTQVANTATGRNQGIWYLDLAGTGYAGGNADLTFDLTGNPAVNGIGFGVVSISGCVPGVAAGNVASGLSVSLDVPGAGGLVVTNHGANGGSLTGPGGHVELYSGDIGSASGAASHIYSGSSGLQSFTYATSAASSNVTSAAAFLPADAAPVLIETSPVDGALEVSLDTNLVASFNWPVGAGASGTITLKKAVDDSTVESFDVTASSRLSFSGSELTIDPSGDLDPGSGYYVLIDPGAIMEPVSGDHFAGIADSTIWNFATSSGLDTVDGRLLWMMQENINDPWPDPASAWGLATYALAAFYLGTDLATANESIEALFTQYPVPDSDTIGFDSYFKLHLVWRIYHDPAMQARLTPAVRATIEEAMWRWVRTRSKLSEAQGTEWVYHGSENHDAMQKGGFLLCLEALQDVAGYGPDRVLADGNTIGAHAAAWSDYFQRYFVGRAREGINAEIASPIYAKYTIGVYYNLMDFADSPALRNLAETFLTLYWADTASDWTLSGVRGGGETRCYKENYLRLGTQYSFNDLLWGYGWHTDSGVVRTYAMIPAVSSYRVPEIITACAADPNRPGFLYTSRRWGRTSGSSGDNNWASFDNGDSSIRRETWVTPEYSMGTITFDMNKDYLQIIDQNRAMGVMFASGVNDRVMVYGKGAGNNKSYADLSGVCREDCMVVQRDKNANSSGNGTMIFVAQSLWDSRVEAGGWLFLENGEAYCAIRPAGSGYTAASAQHGFDLEVGDPWAPVVVQTGQADNYLDFAAFQASVMANAFSYATGTLEYTSEAGETFTVYANSRTTPKVNGVTVDLNPVKTYDSPYLSMVHGEDVATVSYAGYPDLLLDFGGPASAITVVRTGSVVELGPLGGGTATMSFDAGAGADLLVVALSHERSGGTYAVSYGGEALNEAVLGGQADIWYLDLAGGSYAGGAADLVIDYAGVPTVNGVGVGVVSLSGGGEAMALHATGTGETNADTVSLSTTVDDAFVVASFNANAGGAGISVGAPMDTIYASGDIGSARGAAGHENEVAAGSHAYVFAAGNPRKAVAAAFVIRGDGFAGWMAGYPGVGAQSGFGDDPDGDSIANGIESFFGTAPDVWSPGIVMRGMNGATFSFTHPQNAERPSDVSATYRWTKDLVTYHASGAADAEGTRVDFVAQEDTPTVGTTSVTASVSGTPAAQLFVVLEVTQD